MNYLDYILNVLQITIFFFNISIIYLSNSKEIYIDIDNELIEYENNINFSNYSTDIKLLAFYLPKINPINIYYNTSLKNGLLQQSNINGEKSITFGNHSLTNIENEYYKFNEYNQSELDILENKINLAKSHGIYGFAIYYYWFNDKNLLEKPLEIFLNNRKFVFSFMLILELPTLNNKEKYDKHLIIKLIKNIKEYTKDPRYIFINKKVALGIYKPELLANLNVTISFLRIKAKYLGIGELFIISFIKKNFFRSFIDLKVFDDLYIIPQIFPSFFDKSLNSNTEIIYKFINHKNISHYRNNLILYHNNISNKKPFIYDYYKPEEYYMIIKNIIECDIKKEKSLQRFIFINFRNIFPKRKLLEPFNKFGYASLNSISKALFNLPYINNYNLLNLEYSTKIAIQAHIYYENLINEIIHKTNNIPVNFDLFISTDTEFKKEYITNYTLRNSKAQKSEIKIFNNQGRDVFPLLIQLKNKIKKYKYFCHIHTKKSKHIDFGDEWRNYLLNNLLGSEGIISEILTEFENNINLGIIFPEIYYKVFEQYGNNLLGANFNYMETIIKKIAPYLRISTDNLDFPMGNMFWANIKSVYQIFYINFDDQIPNENKQLDGTLMHGIERIWLYLVKYNGFYYKKIFKHF